MCCLIFIGGGRRKVCWIRFVPLIISVCAFDWSSVFEGDGSDSAIFSMEGDVVVGKLGCVPNVDIVVYEKVVGRL